MANGRSSADARPLDAPLLAREEERDALARRDTLQRAIPRHGRRRVTDRLFDLRLVMKVQQRQRSERIDPAEGLRPVPEIVVLAAPADERLVEAADGKIGL